MQGRPFPYARSSGKAGLPSACAAAIEAREAHADPAFTIEGPGYVEINEAWTFAFVELRKALKYGAESPIWGHSGN